MQEGQLEKWAADAKSNAKIRVAHRVEFSDMVLGEQAQEIEADEFVHVGRYGQLLGAGA